MDLCNTYSNLAECALDLDNTYNLKLIILTLFTIISIFMIMYSNRVIIKSTFDIYTKLFTMIFGVLYLISLPIMTLTLRHSINFELFILVLTGIYFVALVVVVGGALLFGTKFLFNLFGMQPFETREMNKYKNGKYN